MSVRVVRGANGVAETTDQDRVYLTVKEAARVLGVSESMVRTLMKHRTDPLPAHDIGTGERPIWRIRTDDIDEWAEKRRVNSDEVAARMASAARGVAKRSA